MSYEAIARRYARAIFDLGKEAGALGPLAEEIASVAQVYAGSDELRNVLSNPLVPELEREAVLVELAERLGVRPIGRDALRLLLRKHRIGALPDIARELQKLVDEEGGVVRAQVTSAGPLADSYLSRLRAEIERATGRKVVLSVEQDPSLIAGVVTKIGDRVVDGSLRARLARFRESLLTT